MRRIIIVFLLMIGLVSVIQADKQALASYQSEERFIFSMAETEETYEVMRLDAQTQENVSIYNFPKMTAETFADLAPQSEIEAVYELGDHALGYLDNPMNVRPYRLAVSPDQQQIAIAVEYNIIVTQVWERVGFTEVWNIDNQGHIKQSALKIGLHSDVFIPYPTITSFRDVYVQQIEWLPSQEGLLISLTRYPRSSEFFDLIVVPLEENTAPFLIGSFNAYGVSPDSRSLFGIADFATLKTYSIDLYSGTALKGDHPIVPYNISGLAVTSAFIHLQGIDTNFSEVGDGGGGLAFLDISEKLYSSDHQLTLAFFPSKSLQIDMPVDMKAHKETLYVMSKDHSIWQMTWDGREPIFTLVIAGPVDFWELNGNGEILFHRTDRSSWHILMSAFGTEKQSQIIDIHWPDQQPILRSDYQPDLIDW
jgi:hypothetical protein